MPTPRTLAAALAVLLAGSSIAALPARADSTEAPRVRRVALDEARAAPRLPSGFSNPMPGGHLAGYAADTGLDIGGFRMPVFAIAAGTLDYAEAGHTRWNGKGDSTLAVRLALDAPIPWKKRQITHVWYAHLTSVELAQPEGASERAHVEAGHPLGVSGFANGAPHLHLGLLLDGDVSQDWGTFLGEDEIRAVLGSLSARGRLPRR